MRFVLTVITSKVIMRAAVMRGVAAMLMIALGAAVICSTSSRAQTPTINDIRGKIFDAQMMQQTFAGGLAHCHEFDGTNFYLAQRDRVISLDDYHRSLDSLALQRVYNPETKRPWSQEDADARWAQVKQSAVTDKANCAMVASLPDLQRQLEDLQRQATAQGDPAADKK